ncbi:MAG: DegT/DnrJ/EryC1/StrS family aminotransferase [Chthoniobacterales bacterium]
MIPLQDFQRHVAAFEPQVGERLAQVVSRGWFLNGPELEEFEARFASYTGTACCVGVGNGTQAMEVALRTLGVGPGDEVVTVANAGMYATCAILLVGATPVFAEIREDTMNMDPESLRRLLERRPKAVIATHLYGQLCDIEEIASLCREKGIALIEDCAEAHGAASATGKAGSFGLAGCFSFYPTKNLGAFGDAGAITTNDAGFAAKLRSTRQYGWSQKYRADTAGGTNSRMDEVQAAVLNVKLDRLDAMNARRRHIAEYYNKALDGNCALLPFTANGNFIVHHYVLRSTQRDGVREALRAAGIGTEIHFPVPDHKQDALKGRFAGVSLPVTEAVCDTVFTVPSFAEMTDAEIEQTARALRDCYRP